MKKLWHIGIIGLLAVIIGCEFHDPVLPSWEVVARLAVAPDPIIIGEKLQVDSLLIVRGNDPDSVLFFSLSGEMDPVELTAEDLSIKPGDINESLHLDTLTIDTLEVLVPPLVNLRTLAPFLENFVGQTVTIPETTLIGPPLLVTAQTFHRVHFLEGTVRLRVLNKLPFAIGPNNSSAGLRVTVINDSLNEQFADLFFPNDILPDQEGVAEEVVHNKTLYSPMRFEYEFPIGQSITTTITNEMLDTTGVQVALELVNIQSDEAEARLKPQHFSRTLKLGYEGDTRLRSATINRGRIALDITNHIDLSTEVQYTIPAIRDASNQPFSDQLQLVANASTHKELVLDGFRIINPDNPGAVIDSLEIQVAVQTTTPDTTILVTGTDSVVVQLVADTLFFGEFAGIIGADTLDIEPFLVEDVADYGGFDGSVQLRDASLRLIIDSGIMIENFLADIVVVGYHKENGVITDSRTLVLNDLAFHGGMVDTIDISGPDFADFLNILPTDLQFSGIVEVSGEASVAVGDRIDIRYLFETPLTVKLVDLAEFTGDEDTLTTEDITPDLQKRLRNNLLEGRLTLTVGNHTPLGGDLRFFITTDMNDPNLYDADFDTSRGFIEVIGLDPAPTDPTTGYVTATRPRTMEFLLSRKEILLLAQPPLRYGFLFRAANTNGFVTLRYSDFVDPQGEIRLKFLVKED
ncbi:MAG: hypothetical protein D6681_20650 [Calditrichaeota bacterium]|nr:MAG: hypothetical protein D6681_20650 [Calditrichota bacterium]